MTLETAVKTVNRGMIGFDLALATATLIAPDRVMRLLGHDEPDAESKHLFRRNAPIWFTFAAAHAVAERRGEPSDWWALTWLRSIEFGTDALWAASPGFKKRRSKVVLAGAGVANMALSAGFAHLAKHGGTSKVRRFRKIADAAPTRKRSKGSRLLAAVGR